jgi:hypothetical protein
MANALLKGGTNFNLLKETTLIPANGSVKLISSNSQVFD